MAAVTSLEEFARRLGHDSCSQSGTTVFADFIAKHPAYARAAGHELAKFISTSGDVERVTRAVNVVVGLVKTRLRQAPTDVVIRPW